MNLKTLAAASIIIVPVLSTAQTPVSTSIDFPFFSKYVWRGVNLVNDPVLQPSVNFEYQGWNLNLWGNYDIDNLKQFTEYDITFSYSGELPQGSWSAGYIDYANPQSTIKHTREFFASFTFNHELSPYIQLNYDNDEVDGLYARFGIEKGIPTSSGDLNLHTWLGFGDDDMNGALYGNNKSGLADFGLEATFSRQFGEQTTGYLKLSYTTLLNKNHLAGAPNRNNLIFGFGVGYQF